MSLRTLLLSTAAWACFAAAPAVAQTQTGQARTDQALTDQAQTGKPQLEQVAEFPHQVTGVTVSEDNRIFVNFPRWTEDSPVSVAEVVDGEIRPYPNETWNMWRNARKAEFAPESHFICVQSVVADKRGSLFVLDPAAPAQAKIVLGGPKLVQIDLKTNGVVKRWSFDQTIAPQGSYLNDVRLSPDGKTAYITDSGLVGAIVVVDLESGKARRLLAGHPSTQVEPNVQVKADGKVLRQPDGRGVEFSADGIALSKDGDWLYWQAIKGRTLYRVDTASLRNESLSSEELGQKVQAQGVNGVADGLLITDDGRMIVTAPEGNALFVRETLDKEPVEWIADDRLRWPDTLSEASDGAIYVTTSRIQDMSFFKPDAPIALPTQLWRIPARQQ
ncbi:major royal jelly family protein [Mesorhizobium sp. RP14(2022)]|uniref:Major royal jelly family protein n=1 Tax=Mesorhizobium liriopis TaxID=2953882 RepID=A0ABT1C6E3_9HYPH|nr:major royal jelly family protein [Mesorhizobium liriopis]MCO6050397.1 major royal jelly family protein [Mesorhizobium liriopis]